jgi:hypothetical protein
MLPSQGLMSELGVVIECSGTLLNFSPCSTFFTTERLTSSPTHLYKKDERALPGDLHSRKLSCVSPLLNIVSRTTHPFSFFSSLYLRSFQRASGVVTTLPEAQTT